MKGCRFCNFCSRLCIFNYFSFRMFRKFFLLLLLGIAVSSQGQDINGVWKGKLVMAAGGCFPIYNVEMQLQSAGTKITGTIYHFSDSMNYVRENFEGTYKPDSNIILIKEIGIITFKIREDCVPCIKTYNLSYHKDGGELVKEEQIRGTWSTPTGKAMDGKTTCHPGTIVLTRFEKSTFKQELRLPATLTKRKAELVKEIKVDTGVIKIDFFDNGQIDGDTISVYVNGMPVVSKKMLTARPITVSIKIDLKKKEQEVIMVGENLGTIPPNTALMIVDACDKRYQLYLTSDETKNAMVRFIYEKPK